MTNEGINRSKQTGELHYPSSTMSLKASQRHQCNGAQWTANFTPKWIKHYLFFIYIRPLSFRSCLSKYTTHVSAEVCSKTW